MAMTVPSGKLCGTAMPAERWIRSPGASVGEFAAELAGEKPGEPCGWGEGTGRVEPLWSFAKGADLGTAAGAAGAAGISPPMGSEKPAIGGVGAGLDEPRLAGGRVGGAAGGARES